MKRKRIGVKLCGNCNPEVETADILCRVKKLLPEGEFEFACRNNPEADMLMVLSGCPVDCATRPPGRTPVVVVAGKAVNLADCPPERLADSVVFVLKEYCKEA